MNNYKQQLDRNFTNQFNEEKKQRNETKTNDK